MLTLNTLSTIVDVVIFWFKSRFIFLTNSPNLVQKKENEQKMKKITN